MTEKLTSWFNLPTFEMIFVSDAILPLLLSAALFRDMMRVYTATERISAEKKHIFFILLLSLPLLLATTQKLPRFEFPAKLPPLLLDGWNCWTGKIAIFISVKKRSPR